MGGKKYSLLGNKYGRLTVIERAGSNKWQKTLWKCLCVCGKETLSTQGNLASGIATSCGCFRKDRTTEVVTIHGGSKTSEYRAYHEMRTRCYKKNRKDYYNYGGRGIVVCKRWLGENGFINFIKDMGKKLSKTYSLDRINNNGNYRPSNCRWATDYQQRRNKRNNTWIEFDGKRMVLMDWANYLKTTTPAIVQMNKHKSMEDTLQYYKNKLNARTA